MEKKLVIGTYKENNRAKKEGEKQNKAKTD